MAPMIEKSTRNHKEKIKEAMLIIPFGDHDKPHFEVEFGGRYELDDERIHEDLYRRAMADLEDHARYRAEAIARHQA